MNPRDEIRALLALAAARALEGAEQAKVEAHVRECADCAVELSSMQVRSSGKPAGAAAFFCISGQNQVARGC